MFNLFFSNYGYLILGSTVIKLSYKNLNMLGIDKYQVNFSLVV